MHNKIYEQDSLLLALHSNQENIAIWGAYQLLLGDPNQIRELLPQFLESDFIEIVEAGVQKIAEVNAEEFVTHVLKIFRESEGQLKYTSAMTLCKFRNHISQKLLENWFSTLVGSDHVTRVEMEAASWVYLEIDRAGNIQNLLEQLNQMHDDGVKSSILLSSLVQFCQSQEELDQAFEHYFILRDLYSDPELSFQIVDYFGNFEIIEWISQKVGKGYSISSIYEQCFTLLDITATVKDRHRWEEIETAFLTYEKLYNYKIRDPELFLNNLSKWVQSLMSDQPAVYGLHFKWLLEAFRRHHEFFPRTISKIIEMETNFLLSIPLSIALEKSFQVWINNPSKYLTQIANYYHSSILTTDHREQVLDLFFPDEISWSEEETRITINNSTPVEGCSQHEIMWKFFRKELLGFHIPWPTIFPNPDTSTRLLSGLFSIHVNNFDYFIEKGEKISVDYALLLFQLRPDKNVINLIVDNFKYLFRSHTEGLFQTIEYIPDPRYVPLLLNYYQEEEFEIVKLISQICEIFCMEKPNIIQKDLKHILREPGNKKGIQQRLRMQCDICSHGFQYFVDRIYVDEGAILRMNKLTIDSIWVPQKFVCKKCSADLPFHLSEIQLEELTLQSRIDRRLKNLPQAQGAVLGQKIFLIDFPRFKTKTYNPLEFKDLVQKYESNSQASPEDLVLLWIKEAKLNRAMLLWQECLDVLKKVEKITNFEIEWVFLVGQANFKLQKFAEARKYFDWIIKHYNNETSNSPFGALTEQSKYFLKSMDSEHTRKTRLKVIK
ncbi:MAG: hypothetical protein GY786_05895 [Proteobacteria bacterium]|nr:hypothetical protein [Pseudomonadota bacterium]